MSFSLTTFSRGAAKSVGTIYAALAPARLVVLVALACVGALLMDSKRRAVLLPRLVSTVLFSILYWALFAGNPWVAANGFNFRYFFPVVLAVVVFIAAPIAAALLTVPLPRFASGWNTSVALVTATLAAAASIVGPLSPPSHSAIIVATKPTADYGTSNDVTFVAGYYWLMWPVMQQMLGDGRTAAYGTGMRSDGDPAAYRAAFDRALANPRTPPRAICVGQAVSLCLSFLEYRTQPGWREVPGDCPMPSLPSGRFPAPQNTCKILEYPAR